MTLRSAVVLGLAVAGCAGTAQAGGPKRPETPFTIHVFTRSADKDANDSTADVKKAIQEKKADWFRLVADEKEADIVLEIIRRDYSRDTENVIRGTVSTATLHGAPIVGQFLVRQQAIWNVTTGPWTGAARDMAGRLEKYCKERYPELADAQRKGWRVGAGR